MSVVPDLYLVERRAVGGRLRSIIAGLARNRTLVMMAGSSAMLIIFAAMVATDGPARIGTIWFVPWVALLAAQLGPIGGALSGIAATALYFAAAELVADADDPLAVGLRLLPLVGVGVVAGLSSRRISSDALELQSTAALQHGLLDSTIDGICLTDVTGNIVLANAPLQRFAVELGLPQHGTVAERLLKLADRTTEPARFATRMRDLGRDLAPSEDEFELAESGRVFRGYTAPVVRKDGTVVGRIWTLREVTADRRLERLRDAFVDAVSHELRTPLTSMSGFLELLADEEHALAPAGRRYLEVIRRSNSRLKSRRKSPPRGPDRGGTGSSCGPSRQTWPRSQAQLSKRHCRPPPSTGSSSASRSTTTSRSRPTPSDSGKSWTTSSRTPSSSHPAAAR
jgi:Signal transduction histidine kinase